MTPKQKGIVTEERCKLYFLERGFTVSVPIGDNARYDMILDVCGTLLKIQIKSCREKDHGDCIHFESTTNVTNRNQSVTHRYCKEEVDYFCTWYNNQAYLIPFEEISEISLRLRHPDRRVGFAKKPRWAIEYEADYVIRRLIDPETEKRDGQQVYEQFLSTKYACVKQRFKWVTDGTREMKIPVEQDVPEGFHSGRCYQNRLQ